MKEKNPKNPVNPVWRDDVSFSSWLVPDGEYTPHTYEEGEREEEYHKAEYRMYTASSKIIGEKVVCEHH